MAKAARTAVRALMPVAGTEEWADLPVNPAYTVVQARALHITMDGPEVGWHIST